MGLANRFHIISVSACALPSNYLCRCHPSSLPPQNPTPTTLLWASAFRSRPQAATYRPCATAYPSSSLRAFWSHHTCQCLNRINSNRFEDECLHQTTIYEEGIDQKTMYHSAAVCAQVLHYQLCWAEHRAHICWTQQEHDLRQLHRWPDFHLQCPGVHTKDNHDPSPPFYMPQNNDMSKLPSHITSTINCCDSLASRVLTVNLWLCSTI